DLLSVYWAPHDKRSNVGGFATLDKDTIVVYYDSGLDLAATVVHELRHKVDKQQLAAFNKDNPDAREWDTIPSLVTEKNAYTFTLKLFEKSPRKSKYVKRAIRHFKEVVSKANLLLGLPENHEEILMPPYEGIRPDSRVSDVDPSSIGLCYEDMKMIKALIIKMGYNPEEVKCLFENCMSIAAGKPVEMTSVSFRADRRNIFIGFLHKLLFKHKGRSEGYFTKEVAASLMAVNQKINRDILGTDKIDWRFLVALIKNYL
ncbi:MAG: hypothetical protein ABIJ26_00775, partial [Candidatus Margulisiibacteriota bacterium]